MMAPDSHFPWPEGQTSCPEMALARIWGVSPDVLSAFRAQSEGGWAKRGRSHSIHWLPALAEAFREARKKIGAGARGGNLEQGAAGEEQAAPEGKGGGESVGGGAEAPPAKRADFAPPPVFEKKSRAEGEGDGAGLVVWSVEVTGRGYHERMVAGLVLPERTEEVRVLVHRGWCLRAGAVLHGCTACPDAEGFLEFLGSVPNRLHGEGQELWSDLVEGGRR